MQQKTDKPTGLLPVPITPHVLDSIERMPRVQCPVGFDPCAGWRCTWSIHTIHGYADRAIGDAGELTIMRRNEDGCVHLDIAQNLYLLDGMSQTLAGECRLMTSQPPVLTDYIFSSTVKRNGETLHDLCSQCAGRIADDRWIHEHNELSDTRVQTNGLSCDWALLAEGASVRPDQAAAPFDVLDNLTVRKTNQCIRRRADLDESLPDLGVLQCWTRIGQATLPVETFVTAEGLVPLVTAANKWWALESVEVLS